MNELKKYLPPIMRNTFWTSLMDVIEGRINEIKTNKIDVIKTYYSLSDSTEEELIELGSTIYQLDSFMLEKLLDFLTELELYITDNETEARARALERLRQEIMKIPYSMSKRGTLEFYSSILEFCGFNYHGIITLTKTEGDVQISPIYTNIDLIPYDSPRTELIIPAVSENFSGSETIVFSTLDQQLTAVGGATYYEKLDTDNLTGTVGDEELRRPILDLTSASDLDSVNLYRKILMLSLVISQTSAMYYSTGDLIGGDPADPTYFYPGAPTFPENLGRYYQSFINLNKRATDVLLFGPMLALNIVRSTINPDTGYDGVVPDGRLIVYSPISTVPASSVGFRLKYYDTNLIYDSQDPNKEETEEGQEKEPLRPTFEEDIYNVIHTPANEEEGTEETLVLTGMCQGEFCGHYMDISPEGALGEGGYPAIKLNIPKSDWSSTMVFRLSTSAGYQFCFLFQLDAFGNIIQTGNSTGRNIVLAGTVDTEQSTEYNVVTITNTGSGGVPPELIRASYLSQNLHSAVKAIQLLSYDADNVETEILKLEFKENTQLELCSGITLFTYLNIHFDGEYDPSKTLSEEAF